MKSLAGNSYTNQYAAYMLPNRRPWSDEDTIAGVPGISLGAGFKYRKKLGKGGAQVPSGN